MNDNALHRLRRDAEERSVSTNAPVPPYPWKTRVLIPGAIALAIIALMVSAAYESFAPAIAVRVAPVVQKTTQGPAPGSAVVQAAGWIEPSPFPTAVSGLADGIVEAVLVLDGETVEAGQVVARLVDDDARLELRRAEAAVALAEAELSAQQAELDAAQTDWDHPVELDRAVSVTEAQRDEMAASLNQVEAEIRAAASVLVEAEKAWRRAERLFTEDDVGTEAALDKERARFESQRAMLEAKRKEGATRVATIARIDAELQAARENRRLRTADRERLHEARASVARANAAVETAHVVRDEKALQLSRMEVRSPVPGVVMRRVTQPGDKLIRMMDSPHSTHVIHLYDPEHLQVRVDVALVDASLISIGQQAEITVETLPNAVLRGEVLRLTHEADIQKNTLEAQVRILDPRPQLRPEMLARVKFLEVETAAESDENRLSLFVPVDAIIDEAGVSYAWKVDARRGDRGLARKVTVNTSGTANGDWIRIESGLQPGDRLVLNPSAELRDGVRVRVMAEESGS